MCSARVSGMVETTNSMDQEQPLKPNWIDRGLDWVKRPPILVWTFFVAAGSVLVLVQALVLWREGGLQDLGLLPVIIFNSFFIPFLLVLIYVLDRQAVTALYALRPILNMTEPEIEQYERGLSHMPVRASLIAGLVMLAIVLIIEQLTVAPARYAALEQLSLFVIVFQVVDKSSAFLFGVFIYHTIRQLRLVGAILACVQINLFSRGPIQAFSRLTGLTAVGLVVAVYGWILISPELLSDPIILGFVAAITILATAVFVWPLLGVHRRMEMEKEGRLHRLDIRLEALFSEFNHALEEDDYAAIGRLNGTIAGLEIQRKRIATIPSWPWRPETAQFVFAAIALPLVLAVIQFLVEQALE